jgi:thioredoxin reductase
MQVDHDVAIVGAGPYGLSLAAHLGARGVSFGIFGEPMQFWRAHMPKGMHLKSDGFASNLYDAEGSYTLKQFCAKEELSYHNTALPVSLETFIKYGLSFQKRFAPDLQRNNVVHVKNTSNWFVLKLDNDEVVTARRVVIAAGIHSFRHTPPSLSHLPPEFLSHSSQHHDLGSYRNRNIVVLGAGASAVDIAALLHEAGATVQLVARDHSVRFHSGGDANLWQKVRHPSSGIGPGLRARFYCDAPWLFHHFPERLRLLITRRTLGPAGAWFMKDKVVGRIPLVLGFKPEGAEIKNGRVRLKLRGGDESERELVTEHIIAATGYKVDLQRLEFLSPEIISHFVTVENTPVLSSTMESSVPGLYFVGAATANSFGPVMRFAFGARFAAPHLARALVKSLSSRKD